MHLSVKPDCGDWRSWRRGLTGALKLGKQWQEGAGLSFLAPGLPWCSAGLASESVRCPWGVSAQRDGAVPGRGNIPTGLRPDGGGGELASIPLTAVLFSVLCLFTQAAEACLD